MNWTFTRDAMWKVWPSELYYNLIGRHFSFWSMKQNGLIDKDKSIDQYLPWMTYKEMKEIEYKK